MRLLITGSDKIHAIENHFVQHAREQGVTLQLFPSTSLFYDYYYQGIFHKLLYRSGLSAILTTINRQFRETVTAFRPDIIWVFKGMELFPESLQWARSQGIKLVNYNTDNPFIFTGRGSGNRYISASLPLYDLFFTYNLDIQKELQRQFAAPVVLLPFAYEISDEIYNQVADQPEKVQACFVGNPDKLRAAFIAGLARQGISIDLYGNNWQKTTRHNNIRVHAPVYGLDLWKVLRQYRVQLNMMRIHNPDSHNMRSFEVPAIGGIMLAPDTADHRYFFKPGNGVFLYRDPGDCASQIRHLLQLPEVEAAQLRLLAREACIKNGHSYADRTRQAIEAIKEKLHA